MSDKLPNVNNAYAMTTRAEVKRLYADWANTYDAAFCEAEGYQLHRVVARAFVGAGGSGPVLDFGAGTGVVGEMLASLDVGPLDAVDLSAEMLDVARNKTIYRDLNCADVLSPGHGLPSDYQGIVSAGTFTLGHVGPDGLQPLLDLAASGARFALSINAEHFDAAGFAAALDALAIADLVLTPTRIYDDRAHADHREDMAIVATFRKA